MDRETQLQVAKNDHYVFNLREKISKFWCLNTDFIPKNIVIWQANKII